MPSTIDDEKTSIVNMVSEGTISLSEGIALFKVLCGLEGLSCYEDDMEVESPKHAPPWEFDEVELRELLARNECVKAIAFANRQVISALKEGNLEDIPLRISALDVLQLSGFKPMPEGNVSGGFALSYFYLKVVDAGIRRRGGGIDWEWRIINPEAQVSMEPAFLRLKWGADQVMSEEMGELSTIESSSDSVVTKAGHFDGCLKLRIGARLIWLAPKVGVVKFLREHPVSRRIEAELANYRIRGGQPLYFPLSPGNSWQYRWQDKFTVHQELVRVILDIGNGIFALSCANHVTGR